MPIVELPNGQSAEFPDSMSKEQIKSVIQKKFSSGMNQGNVLPKNEQINQIMSETGGNRTPLDTLRDLGAGVISGVGKGLQSAANPTDLVLPQGKSPQINMDQFVEPISSPNKSIGGQVIRGIGEYLPYGLAGGASLPGQLAAGGAFGAATTEPGEQNLFGMLPSGKTGGALKNALLNAITHGGFQLFNAMRPSNLLRGNLSPQELQANVAAAGETPTGLGDVIGSPFLKRQHENILSKIPFSGANQKFQQAGQEVVKRGENLLKNILGENNPENITDQLGETLTNQFNKHQKLKESLYDKFNDVAHENKLHPNINNFKNVLRENKSLLENMSLLKGDPIGNKIFEKIRDYTGIFNKPNLKMKPKTVEVPDNTYKNPLTGLEEKSPTTKKIMELSPSETKEPYTPLNASALVERYKPSYQEANILKGRLNKYAELSAQSPDPAQRSLANVYKDLGKALRQDIHESVSNSKNPKLINAYNKAEEDYAKNFSPFLDKEVYKFISGKADTDTIVQNFLKMSQGVDRSKVLSKLTSKLSDKEKELLAYSYFSRAMDKEGNLNPAKLSTLINKLGKNQFKTLVPNANIRKQLMNYNRLYKMNTKSVNMMQNPATGQQNLDIIPALLGHAGTVMTGGAFGGLPGALAGLAAPGLISRPLVNALTNPKTRRALVNAMINNKPWNKNAITALQTGERGLDQNK